MKDIMKRYFNEGYFHAAIQQILWNVLDIMSSETKGI